MNAILICPADRPAFAALEEIAPLSNLPLLGSSLTEYWLEHLAKAGAKEVLVLATDRPEQVRALVGDGARWGLRVEVAPEMRELTPAEARAKYQTRLNSPLGSESVILMDHLPGLPERSLFNSYRDWFGTFQRFLSRKSVPSRIGLHEIQPGVWAGMHTHIAMSAQFRPPCWLGESVRIGSNAIIGPMAILEDKAWVEADTQITNSFVGPETLVGEGLELKNSLAWGNNLINWQTGSCARVLDVFWLCTLGRRRGARKPAPSLIGRAAAVAVMGLTAPFGLFAAWNASRQGLQPFRKHLAVRPHCSLSTTPNSPLVYYDMPYANRWLRRWPQLWNVARGEFAWVGNRPLTLHQAASLRNDFEQLWLEAPIGLVSLADLERYRDGSDGDAKVHSSFYTACANWRLDLSILAGLLWVPLFAIDQSGEETFDVTLRPAVLKEGG
jgi:hypothetical protein